MVLTFYLQRIILVFVIAVTIAALTTPLSIKLAYKLDVIDRPRDDRRVHKRPIPRLGGMGIFLGSMAALVIPAGMNVNIKIAMMGGILMYAVGVADDIADLKPIVKFACQAGIAALVYSMGIRIRFISNYFGSATVDSNANIILGTGVGFIITVLWIVGVTNAVNLMDGLDGLAAGSTAIMALSLAYVAYIHGARLGAMSVCIALIAVAGGCIGFLPYNFSPAKTFMGDGGALYLGYMIAVLSVISPLKRATFVGAVIPMLALAVPILDTAFAMLRRIMRHESIMKADKGHLHHHLMAAGIGQRRSVLIMYGIVGIMGIVAVLISRELYLDALMLAMIALLYLAIIVVPKLPKKNLRTIITQDARDIEKEQFAMLLNHQREMRRRLQEEIKEELRQELREEVKEELLEELLEETADIKNTETERKYRELVKGQVEAQDRDLAEENDADVRD
ncbi:MAG: undecaprenyl/decaprenyl-phosphate alpha-N-acetylglucosaminyl 1-phosphate transferase [Mogibacterium sp.]|nr:undecaprenyl/decaprenyl-phosphate alpha-N-acetylglucosaminyl 1-phosphate transferase [Mogibacterium sp.]